MFYLVIILITIYIFIFLKNKCKEKFNNDKLNICICMSHTENIYPYSKLTEKINKRYANFHNYDFKIFNENMTDRSPQWSKIKVVNKLLKINKYDYLFWIDADAFFNKQNDTLENIIKNDKDKDIIICDDFGNSGRDNTINTGTFFVKCTEWSKLFFNLIWNYDGEYLYKALHEQTVFEKFMNDNILNCKEHISVKSATLFNSEINVQLHNKTLNDNFIIHLMAKDENFRVNFLNDWIKQNSNFFV